MGDRERLLDELGLVFARAAVDALLLEQETKTTTPATSAKGAGVRTTNIKKRNSNGENSTRQSPRSATT